MKLVFSETRSDYSRYLYPYVIWALPEPGEGPVDFFRRGFLPASPRMDRYYLCRNLRLPLARWRPSSENRRILRKGAGTAVELVPRAAFDYSAARREAWKAYADVRFGDVQLEDDVLVVTELVETSRERVAEGRPGLFELQVDRSHLWFISHVRTIPSTSHDAIEV